MIDGLIELENDLIAEECEKYKSSNRISEQDLNTETVAALTENVHSFLINSLIYTFLYQKNFWTRWKSQAAMDFCLMENILFILSFRQK